MMAAQTIFDKIGASHVVAVEEGEALVYVDRALIHEGSSRVRVERGLAVCRARYLLRRTASSAMKANENATASNTTVERISSITTPQERQCGARFADES